MCGICGEIRFDGRSADVAAVTRMTCAMESRGPDSDGVVAHGPIAFGHRRLSIIDLSARGAQPMVDSDLGLTLVFNGCIYNYQELRNELRPRATGSSPPPTAKSSSRGSITGARECVERFKGMFAFAVADRETGVVHWRATGSESSRCTWPRRRVGCDSRPPCVRWSMPVTWTPTIDRYALHHYMSFHSVVPAPRTMYQRACASCRRRPSA